MSSSSIWCLGSSTVTVNWRFCSPLTAVRCSPSGSSRANCSDDEDEHYYSKRSLKYWDKFYKRHQDKFFKDWHYLVKDWGSYFDDYEDGNFSKVVLEVGCGAGNTIYPLLEAFPSLYVHACDFSPQAISLVKSHPNFNSDRINVFVSDVASDNLICSISPSSVDVITLIFSLSAVSPKKMPSVLQNLKKVLKPNGYILFRDYAVGDSSQVKLQERNQLISENFCFRGDGTCSYYFSEEFLSKMFSRCGLDIVDVSMYCRQTKNRSRNITMQRDKKVIGNLIKEKDNLRGPPKMGSGSAGITRESSKIPGQKRVKA